ncbi:hypothetical protein AWB78_08274 [Caballeronia calidae]|uniref:KfrB domain-containing protein n=1 Tax=Caballeronia calidae TaxID=1777139 RepID=A0A158EKA6_9BURK|nr:hypothetical protein AWB78_08274 [Caballeronia calidae]
MSQPENLPSGLWEKLLPNAFVLMDEISTHGGVSNPFFTFGGGTVLMLRHNHRLSKDIDIFVPDPQSLGFITPRLSDVADALCDSQYVEGNGFVKLQMDLGEVDFVASSNLLPDALAFETWELCGRSIRVETAAEIIAKKMYHRGNQGTARDIFDLAMVIEREPEALPHAQGFMYRFLDRMSDSLKSPPEAMKQRFAALETLAYTPTFDQAVGVVQSFLANLQTLRERSAKEASAFIRSNGLIGHSLDATKGEYFGPIVHETARHIVQEIGRSEAVAHDRAALSVQPGQHRAGSALTIRYRNGGATVTAAQRSTLANRR